MTAEGTNGVDQEPYAYVFGMTESVLRDALQLVADGMTVDSVMTELFLAGFSGGEL